MFSDFTENGSSKGSSSPPEVYRRPKKRLPLHESIARFDENTLIAANSSCVRILDAAPVGKF